MDINQFLGQIKNTVNSIKSAPIPGYGVGQAMRGALTLPSQIKEQDSKSAQLQQVIDQKIKDAEYLKAHGIKPNYDEIQKLYESKAQQELQFAKDVESVRNQGVASLATSALTLAAPAIGNYINQPMLRNIPVIKGASPKYSDVTLIQQILSKLTGK